MKHSEFQVGAEFTCSDETWLCTDKGSRVIVAICVSAFAHDLSWLNGPPYAVSESVFDEDDIIVCEPSSGISTAP